MTRIPQALVGVALAATVGFGAAACGSDSDDYAVPTTYGTNGQCYYANDPSEAVLLQQQGLCPVNWVPVHAPDWWLVQYALFYSSPRYYDHYVPSYQRNTYKVTINNYDKSHKTQIDQAESTYRTQRASQRQRQQSTKTYGSSGRSDRAGGTSGASRSSSSSRSTSTRSYSSGGAALMADATPPWGTADSAKPANEQRRRYSVFGFYDENGERWCKHIDADSAREAERQAVANLPAEGQPWACAVAYVDPATGQIVPGDTYAKYLDPDDPRGRGTA